MIRSLPVVLLVLAVSPALACETVELDSVEITRAWSRASIGTERPGVLYLTIHNRGSSDETLTAIATPVAEQPMLHETVVQDGVASMPHTTEIAVPAGATVVLEPGGYHGMLMGLTQPLEAGETFPVTLTFGDAGEVTVPVAIRSIGATGSGCASEDG